MRPLSAYRKQMDRWFGTIDREGVLRPLYARLDQLRGDPAIQAAFRKALRQAAEGPDPVQSVRAAMARYIDGDELGRYPELARIVADMELLAEVKAVRVTNLAGREDEGEPTAEEIASFALQRVREVNAAIGAQEDMCMSSRFTNAVEALSCLSVPGIITGQKGFGARLIEVRKIGCTTEVAGAQYLCQFTQEIDMNMPGGEAFGGDTLARMARQMSRGEAVDARFMRSRDGGWNIVSGDLR
jgi:hypothetical protein